MQVPMCVYMKFVMVIAFANCMQTNCPSCFPVGLSLAQPCQNLAIIRSDTSSDVTHSIVLLNGDSTDPDLSFRCQNHHGSTAGLMWLPSPQTEYSGVLRELQNIQQTFFSRYSQLIRGDLVVGAQGQEEGFYLCTDLFNFGCYLGVFQRSSLGMHACMCHATYYIVEVIYKVDVFIKIGVYLAHVT